MPGNNRKRNKQSTGTVPKIKPYDFSAFRNVEERPTAYANNLTTYGHHPPDSFNILRNRRGTHHQNNYFTMDAAIDGFLPSVQNMLANETTANTSSSNSRRNSSGSTLKCDNITKYPDKNQVEQKLEQIREYLKITSSLMTSMRNTDEQTGDYSETESLEKMISDLKDSETKLTDILDHMNAEDGTYDEQAIDNGMDELSLHSTSSNIRNDIDINLDDPNHEIDALKEQQLSLMQLQQKAEYKLRGARQIHSNLLQATNESNSITNAKDGKNFSDFDAAIRELEERAKRLRPAEPNNRTEDHFMAGVETLHNQMMSMRCANNEREHLIEALDNQDAALRSEHEELQNKLVELQKKKSQVDMLVAQLQNFGEEEDGDVGGQVRTIVTMKEQLKKLKDMLEIVKTTENIMQNTNSSAEVQAAASDICSTAEHFLDKKLPARVSNDTSTGVKPKQINKNKREHGAWRADDGGRSKPMWNGKQNGLEDIMGTRKASTSNLNHHNGHAERKVESNIWYPPSTPASSQYGLGRRPRTHRVGEEPQDDNIFVTASDDGRNVYQQPPPEVESPGSDDRPPRLFQADSPESYNQARSNVEQEDEPSIRDRFKCIKDLCATMLANQTTTGDIRRYQMASNSPLENQATSNVPLNQQNVFQLRNNLTPSQLSNHPANSEPHEIYVAYRNSGCPCPRCQAGNFNGAASADDSPAEVPVEISAKVPAELNVLADGLEQLCELMKIHHTEFLNLKSNVAWIQNKLESIQLGQARDDNAALEQNLVYINNSRSPKANQVSSAYSLPNLNHYIPHCANTKPKSTGFPKDRSNNAHALVHANNSPYAASSNQGQVVPNPMWNGQALNNQVAPGNRANNYWDNFRSYSRQNLFSTKNIDHLHNPSGLDRSNAVNGVNEHNHPFMMPHPTYKPGQAPMFAYQDNAPHERYVRYEANATPDVLNVNRSSSSTKGSDQARAPSRGDNTDEWIQTLLGLNNYASNHSNVFEHRTPERNTRRNEWAEDVAEERVPNSIAFAESREKVYKEVASLISLHESRPHYLIQLFKGLQAIHDSEEFRKKTLQAIHMLISETPNQRQSPQQTANHSSRQPVQQVSRQPDQQSSRHPDQQSYQLSPGQQDQQSARQPIQQSSRQQDQQSYRQQDQQSFQQPDQKSSMQLDQKSSRRQDQQSSRQQDQQPSLKSYQQSSRQSSLMPGSYPVNAKTAMKKLPVWTRNAQKNVVDKLKAWKYEKIMARIGTFMEEREDNVVTNLDIVTMRHFLDGCPAFGRDESDREFWGDLFPPIIESAMIQYRGNRFIDISELMVRSIIDIDFDKECPKNSSDHELPHLLLERDSNKSNVVQGAEAQEQKDSYGSSELTDDSQKASQHLSEQPPQQLHEQPPQQLSEQQVFPQPPQHLSEQPPQQHSEQPPRQLSEQQRQQIYKQISQHLYEQLPRQLYEQLPQRHSPPRQNSSQPPQQSSEQPPQQPSEQPSKMPELLFNLKVFRQSFSQPREPHSEQPLQQQPEQPLQQQPEQPPQPDQHPNIQTTQPKSPSTHLKSPLTQPKSPSTQPKSPSTQPKSPSTQPKSPSTQPKSPSTQPKSPSTQPKSPSTQPKSPPTKPKSPSTQPKSPSMQPKSPSTQPRSPQTQPKSPSTQPRSPPTQPKSPSTQPHCRSGWPKSLRNFEICRTFANHEYIDLEIGTYLDDRSNDVILETTVLAMIQLLFGSSEFGKVTKDEAFNVVRNALVQFVGHRVCEVRDLVLLAIRNAVPDIEFDRDSAPERRLPDVTNGDGHQGRRDTDVPQAAQEQMNNSDSSPKTADHIENEELAEADQSRTIEGGAEKREDEEEEGAVGGAIDVSLGTESDNLSMETCVEEGLCGLVAIEDLRGVEVVYAEETCAEEVSAETVVEVKDLRAEEVVPAETAAEGLRVEDVVPAETAAEGLRVEDVVPAETAAEGLRVEDVVPAETAAEGLRVEDVVPAETAAEATCAEEVVMSAEAATEVLDQVPTKLPIKVKGKSKSRSRSSTPKKDQISAKLEYDLF